MKVGPLITVGAGLGLGLVVLALVKKLQGSTVSAMASTAVGVVADTAGGAVLGIGDAVGLPRTDLERGRDALANGDYWNASFLLPAGEFITGSWNRLIN